MNTMGLQLYDVALSNNVDQFIVMRQAENMVISNDFRAPPWQTNLCRCYTIFIPVKKLLWFPWFGSKVDDWSPIVVVDHWMAARTIQGFNGETSLRHVHQRKLRCSQVGKVEVPQTFCRQAWSFFGIRHIPWFLLYIAVACQCPGTQ